MQTVRRRFFVLALAALVFSTTLVPVGPAGAIDVVVFEELKETAVEYGRYNGRFITCDIRPPVPIRAAFLKYARSLGASDHHLEILSKIFSDGETRTTGLRTGFSKSECEEKLAQPEAQRLLEQVTGWYALPPHLKE